jgi:hypothetical protein
MDKRPCLQKRIHNFVKKVKGIFALSSENNERTSRNPYTARIDGGIKKFRVVDQMILDRVRKHSQSSINGTIGAEKRQG